MLRTGLLISGNLGFKLLKHLQKNKNVQLLCIFTDSNSTEIIEYCKKYNLVVFKGNPRNKESIIFLKKIGEIDILFSINYLFIINKEIIEYSKLYTLNIHGSLLPKYRGRTPHVWAIINGENKAGATVHEINIGVDTGDILLQKEVEITKENTGAEVLKKYNSLYPELIDETIRIILKREVSLRIQDDSKATYFGKRTPADGEINWNWNRERIKNWIRAQANPYPGAFTYLDKKKMIINKVNFSNIGYTYQMKNGRILSINPLIVKTSNGALEILEYAFEENKEVNIKTTKILGNENR